MATMGSNEAFNPNPGMSGRAESWYRTFKQNLTTAARERNTSVAGLLSGWNQIRGGAGGAWDAVRNAATTAWGGMRGFGNWITARDLPSPVGANNATLAAARRVRRAAVGARMLGLGALAGGAYLGYRGIQNLFD